VVAALLWAAVSGVFSWYVSTLGDYNATYGSLSAVIVFMTWLWLSAAVILIGAEMNAELEHQTARDTTTGMPKPLGMRGAVVADHIGPAVVAD
jgi:membrane protein